MQDRLIIACCAAGTAFLCAGVLRYRDLSPGRTIAWRVLEFSPVLIAASIAVFSMEHLFAADDLSSIVPRWLTARVFWVYFTGVCLLAAAVSFVARIGMRWAAPLLALLFFVFVAAIHIPNVLAHPEQRVFWNVMLRELMFCGGILILSAHLWSERREMLGVAHVRMAGRVLAATGLMVFAVEECLFPHFAPGIPLPKLTPSWVPFPTLWAYCTGFIFAAGGVTLLRDATVARAALTVGCVFLLLDVFLYGPILVMDFGSPRSLEGINYVFDTLLAAGTSLACGLTVRTELSNSQ